MEPLGKLLSRLRSALGRDALNKEIVTGSVKEILGFEIRLQDVSIKDDALRIETTPVKRNEIKLHEQKILEKVREKTGLNLKRITY